MPSSSRWCLRDTEETWNADSCASANARYPPPILVLFTGATQSACGLGQSAMGPFYCPSDRKVYLDLSFFQRPRDAIRGAGRLRPGLCRGARSRSPRADRHRPLVSRAAAHASRGSEREANALSVRQELQADCYAGVWGHYAAQRGLLEPGDAEEGLQAAAAIGDDRLQRQTQGRVVPESFTHGSSEQRVHWLRRGLDSGQVEACDTFGLGTR